MTVDYYVFRSLSFLQAQTFKYIDWRPCAVMPKRQRFDLVFRHGRNPTVKTLRSKRHEVLGMVEKYERLLGRGARRPTDRSDH